MSCWIWKYFLLAMSPLRSFCESFINDTNGFAGTDLYALWHRPDSWQNTSVMVRIFKIALKSSFVLGWPCLPLASWNSKSRSRCFSSSCIGPSKFADLLTLVSVMCALKVLMSSLNWRLRYSASRSRGMFWPAPPWGLQTRFHSSSCATLGVNKASTWAMRWKASNAYLVLWSALKWSKRNFQQRYGLLPSPCREASCRLRANRPWLKTARPQLKTSSSLLGALPSPFSVGFSISCHKDVTVSA